MDISAEGSKPEQPIESLDSEDPGNPGTLNTADNPGTSDELKARLSPPITTQRGEEEDESSFGPALPPGHIGQFRAALVPSLGD